MKQAGTEVVIGDEQPRDCRGRRRVTRERRAEVVQEYERSGLTQTEFARRAGLNKTTFAHWVQCARKAPAPVTARPRFVEVQTAAPLTSAPAAPLHVTLPDGVVLRGADPVALAALARALRAR